MDENSPVRSAALLYKGKRVAVMQSFDYTITTNDAQEICDGGTFFTDGVPTGRLSTDCLSPVEGVGVSIVQDALNHKTVDIALGLVDGKIHQCKARSSELNFKSTVADGKVMGTFQWMLKKPKIT